MDVSGGSGQPRSGSDEPAEHHAGPAAPAADSARPGPAPDDHTTHAAPGAGPEPAAPLPGEPVPGSRTGDADADADADRQPRPDSGADGDEAPDPAAAATQTRPPGPAAAATQTRPPTRQRRRRRGPPVREPGPGARGR